MSKYLRVGVVLAAVLVAGECAVARAGDRLEPAGPGKPQLSQQTGGAAAGTEAKPAAKEKSWMLLPLLSSNPKLGTSVGLAGGALHHFDERSRVSMFGFSAQRSSTGSALAALTARTSFGEDRHRVRIAASGGRVINNYEDYLGTGIALKSVDTALGINGSYLNRVTGNWFAGLHGVVSNFQTVGQTPGDEETLDLLGVTGQKSGGVGVVVQNDSRDNDNRPTQGWVVNLDNIAYRRKLGSDYDYDAYRCDLRGYWGHGAGHVFAVRQNNQWTFDAPLTASSSISLRGYKNGQYLGRHVSSIEAEERFRLARRWGATVFLGLGCLYGEGESCTDGENLYPSAGGGVQFVLVPREGIVGNLEFGIGKQGNSGVYLNVGYSF